MLVGDSYVFPGFLTPVLTQHFFPNPPTTFLTCFCRGERRKFARKKSRLNRGSNSQPLGHKSDTLTTEPPGRWEKEKMLVTSNFTFSYNIFSKFQPMLPIQADWHGSILFVNALPLYHTIQTFNDPEKEGFWKHCGKRRKCWWTSIFSFSHNVLFPLQKKFNFAAIFIFLSANPLTGLKICCLGKNILFDRVISPFFTIHSSWNI